MKFLFLLFLLLISCFSMSPQLYAQIKPTSLSVSYQGEMITHPGLKAGLDFYIKQWRTERSTRSATTKTLQKSLIVSPTTGFFYHKRYQTGITFLTEGKFERRKPNGKYVQYGLGMGYLRTMIPNTYEVNPSGRVSKVGAGYNYFATNYSVTFGRDLSKRLQLPIDYFIKPQFLYDVPNFPKGVGYLLVEFGITYRLG